MNFYLRKEQTIWALRDEQNSLFIALPGAPDVMFTYLHPHTKKAVKKER